MHSLEKKVENPQIDLKYEAMIVPEKSSLKNFEDIFILNASGKWEKGRLKGSDTFISFLYRPMEKERK